MTGIATALDILMGAVLLYLFVKDIRERKLPNAAILLLFVTGLLKCLTGISEVTLLQRMIGALLLFLTAALLYGLTETRGIGGGDVKLMAALGWCLGIDAGLLTVFLAGLLALVVSGLLRLSGKQKQRVVPLAPYLVTGAFAAPLLLSLLDGRF